MSERLPLPDVVNWPIFPFEGDLRVKELAPRLDHEYPRAGDPDGRPCRCEGDDDRTPIWSNGRWVLHHLSFGEPGSGSPFPAYMLETVDHLDFGDLDDEMAAEFGLLCVRLERAVMGLGTVGRVHVNRWGDGASHCHVWFLGRPKGAWQFSGFSLPYWGFILPAQDTATRDRDAARVAAALG